MSTPKILLVDDTRLLREMEISFLANSPVTVLTAENGQDALAVMGRELPDLVLLDQNMPVMNGIDCVSAMRNTPAMKQIPVIMVSSSTRREDHHAFLKAGCNDFLPKPLERNSFLAKVRQFLPVVEQRGPRVPCPTAVEFEIDGRIHSGACKNLSLNGLYVATDFPARAESPVFLRFVLPGRGPDAEILVKGRIAWVNSSSGRSSTPLPRGFGVEFMEIVGKGLPLLRRKEIREFVESKLREERG